MKSLYLRSCVALLCAVSLAACGGGHGTLVLAGTITGLTQDGLVLTNNGGSNLAVARGVATFQFADLLNTDAKFDVEVKTQPTETLCTPSSNTGTASSFNTTTLVISCVTNPYKLTGNVSGLPAGSALIVANGNNKVTLAADGAFAFSPVAYGAPYTVSVLPGSAPSGKSCSVSGGANHDGTGRMVTGGVTDILVTCI